jgi:hypothetical protein
LDEICSAVFELLHEDRWTDRQTDKAKLIGAFSQIFIENVPKTMEMMDNTQKLKLCSETHF